MKESFRALISVALALSMSLAAATAAEAKKKDPPPPVTPASDPFSLPCSTGDVAPAALLCSGYFEGNLISGNSGDVLAQQAGLSAIGFTWDGAYSEVYKLKDLGGADPVFTQLLTGYAFIGIHYGAGSFSDPKPTGGATAFYKIDAGVAGTHLVDLVRGSSSNAYYYGSLPVPCEVTNSCGGGTSQTVPEPATWAMMILGFGAVGALMRRRRTVFG